MALHLRQAIAVVGQVPEDLVPLGARMVREGVLGDGADARDDCDDLGEVLVELLALGAAADGGEEGLDRVDDGLGLVLEVVLQNRRQRDRKSVV